MLKEYRFDTGEVELNYAKGPDSGPPLVLLHGLTSRWHDFRVIMPYLLLTNTVYAVDLRGHGKSGRMSGRYRGLDYAEDTRSLIEGVMGEPAILLGSSTGGLVAALLASRHPEWVSAAILEEPVPWVPPEGHWVYEYFAECRELTSMGKTAEELREVLQPEQARRRRNAKRMSLLDRGPVDAFFDKSHWEGFDAEEMLESISCPTLFLYGDWEKGSELTPDQVETIQSAIPDCVSDFVDAGHNLHVDQPVQMALIVMAFLESL